jgi:hypothetical protein
MPSASGTRPLCAIASRAASSVRAKNLLGVVLDLAGLGKVLRDFAVTAAGYAAIGGDDHTGRAGGAFVNRQD